MWGDSFSSASSFIRYRFMCWFWTREMLSSPPPTAIFCWSNMTCLAAVAMPIRPEAHWRSRLMPGTEEGRPAARAT
ncbi:hypothetical protein D3C71_2004860 [compost metagenome]